MPLKLIPPRAGRSKNYRVRGTYLGRYVDQSAGTHEKRLAEKVLRSIRGQIERGELAQPGDPTFLSAAVAYMEAGREGCYLGRAIEHFGETPLKRIDQAAIEAGAVKCLPLGSAATRNRYFYTPVSAVLKHAGVDFKIRRLPGAGGAERTVWLEPAQAFRLFDDDTMRRLRHSAHLYGTTVELLAENAISNAAMEATRDDKLDDCAACRQPETV